MLFVQRRVGWRQRSAQHAAAQGAKLGHLCVESVQGNFSSIGLPMPVTPKSAVLKRVPYQPKYLRCDTSSVLRGLDMSLAITISAHCNTRAVFGYPPEH